MKYLVTLLPGKLLRCLRKTGIHELAKHREHHLPPAQHSVYSQPYPGQPKQSDWLEKTDEPLIQVTYRSSCTSQFLYLSTNKLSCSSFGQVSVEASTLISHWMRTSPPYLGTCSHYPHGSPIAPVAWSFCIVLSCINLGCNAKWLGDCLGIVACF